MKPVLALIGGFGAIVFIAYPGSAGNQTALNLVYPTNNQQTTADRIFLIGTASPDIAVTVNGQPVGDRSPAGHFAPSVPLQIGDNALLVRAGDQEIRLRVQRLATGITPPTGLSFAPDSLTPAVNLARMPNEPICFQAIANPQSQVFVKVGATVVPLQPKRQSVELPPNAAVLTSSNQPQFSPATGRFEGCTAFASPGDLGNPIYSLRLQGQTLEQSAPGRITILNPAQFSSVEVIRALGGVARTGPGTDYSRLTPLPPGTRARVTAQEGEWLRLDYGGWIKQAETRPLEPGMPVQSIIRSLHSRQIAGWTEVILPLQVPVPLRVEQGEQSFTLTLSNTTAQTDVIALNDDPVIRRLDWQQVAPQQVEYRFHLKSRQQWGYKLRYAGSSLILSLRHPPQLPNQGPPLNGLTLVLDPGHGGPTDLGSVGPTGYAEKSATLILARFLEQELIRRGARVVMTRTEDVDLDLQPRLDLINQTEPAIALSLHYNALPDNGDAIATQGIGSFWYQSQSHDLAVFLHNYLVSKLARPSYGVFWNNLALARPSVAPSVLLELGFMINPREFEWIANPPAQKQLATVLADGLTQWLRRAVSQTGDSHCNRHCDRQDAPSVTTRMTRDCFKTSC